MTSNDTERDELPICDGLGQIADSIAVGRGGAVATDAQGGHVGSLTEAVMEVTDGLTAIAEAISDLAEAVRDSKDGQS